MPVGTLKNTLYAMALPLAGKRCEWRCDKNDAVGTALRRRHAVGACVQRFEKGKLTACHAYGYASLQGTPRQATPDTVFRTASVAKMVSAMLVMRLHTLGKLSVQQDVSDLLGMRVRNPRHPGAPITLGMLLSHTSSIVDSPAYFAAFQRPVQLADLLADPAAYCDAVPGMAFRYSNFAAGMVACLLEQHLGDSFETIAQRELFAPLGVTATFDPSVLQGCDVADSYRVLPAARALDASSRVAAAVPMTQPDVQHRYLVASGNLYITAPQLAKLAVAAATGADGFLSEEACKLMRTPIAGWPEPGVRMRHGMGLLEMDEPRICPRTLWGHQGFAYGAVNGVFFDADANGFVLLNSGVSEQREGHLAVVNRDLITLLMKE